MDQEPKAVWSKNAALIDAPELMIVAQAMIVARQALHGTLPSELIPDPALDILLALFVAGVRGERLSTSKIATVHSCQIVAQQRWLNALQQYALIDADDAGYGLSIEGREKMIATLRAIVSSQNNIYSDV